MKNKLFKTTKTTFFLLLVGCLVITSCIKKNGCEYMEGLYHKGYFQYYKNPIDSIGNNINGKLEFDYYDETNTIYFIGNIPKEFRNDQIVMVNVVCEPVYINQEFPVFYRIKCIEKTD